MPSFSYRHIKDLYPVFWSKAVQMTNEIEKGVKQKNGEDTVQISNWSGRAMLDIIGLAGINDDFNSVKDPKNELARRYESLGGGSSTLQLLVALVCFFFIGFKWFFHIPTKENRNTLDAVKYIREVSHKHVNEKRLRIEQGEGEGENTAVDILSVAMRSGSFTDSNLVDQMMTFLAAGHETTSSAFQWSIYALSKHPEVQTRLRKEIRESLPSIPFADLDDTKNVSDIKHKFSSLFTAVDSNNHHSLPFLWAVVNEILRFYPSVPFTSREALRDTTLAGQYIPKGTTVLVAPDVTNRDVDVWGEDAEEFNPERWLDNNEDGTSITHNNHGGAKSNYANLTFIHGPRSCIGQGFARAELAIFVVVFVYRFEFELSEPEKELEIRREITQAPTDGVVVRVRTYVSD
jgi:cytochrome P450